MLDALYEKAKLEQTANRCVVAEWGNQLTAADKEAFNKSIADDDFSNKNLFNLYKDAGANFSLTSLRAHRVGECGCR